MSQQPPITPTPPSESRELSLLSTVELRIASASTDPQLQKLITTYLPPLLLKLGSPHAPVRAKTRTICQHIIVRLRASSEIEIPAEKLVEQFWDLDDEQGGRKSDAVGKDLRDDVRRFELVFVSMGLWRITFVDGRVGKKDVELLKSLLRIPGLRPSDSASDNSHRHEMEVEREEKRVWIQPQARREDMSLPTRLWLYGLFFLLKTLHSGAFFFPARASQEDRDMAIGFDFNQAETDWLANYLTKVLLAEPLDFSHISNEDGNSGHAQTETTASPTPQIRKGGLTAADITTFYDWIIWMGKDNTPGQAAPQLLTPTKPAVAQFLFTSIFNDRQRFMPAVILSADDTSTSLFRIGDTMFKQCEFDLEDLTVVDGLYDLYFAYQPAVGGQDAFTHDGDGLLAGYHQNARGSLRDPRWLDNQPRLDPSRRFIGEGTGTGASLPGRPKLQVRILSLLAKSKMATTRTDEILHIVRERFDGVTHKFDSVTSRSRKSVLILLNWMLSVGSNTDISAVAAHVTAAFRSYIAQQGWPDPTEVKEMPTFRSELDLRAKAYENIGAWAPKIDFNKPSESAEEGGEEEAKLDLVRFLLSSLSCDNSSIDIQFSIDLALSRLINLLAEAAADSVAMRTRVRELVMGHMSQDVGDFDETADRRTIRSTSFPAVRFANSCLPFEDCVARWIDILAVGEGRLKERNELVEEGSKGLDPYVWSTVNHVNAKPSQAAASSSRQQLPDFAELVLHLFSGDNGEKLTQDPQGLYRFALPTAVGFCRHILILEALRAGDMTVEMEPEWEKKTDAMLSNNQKARSSIRSYLVECVTPSVLTRLINAALIGMTLKDDGGDCADIAVGIASLVPDEIIGAMIDAVSKLKYVSNTNDMILQSRAARALGIFASHPNYQEQDRKQLISLALTNIEGWREAVGAVSNRIRGEILSVAFILSRRALRRSLAADEEETVSAFFNLVTEITLDSRDSGLVTGAHVSIGQLMLCLDETMGLRKEIMLEKVEKLIDVLKAHANKGQESAIIALGRLTRGLNIMTANSSSGSSSSDQITEKALESLLSLHETKRSEIQFAVGEALSVAAAGWNSSVTIAELDVDVARPSHAVNEDMLVRLLDKVIQDSRNPKPSLKKASAIWLLCLIQFLGEQPAVQTRLRQCQAAFAGLLTSRDEIVQEAGSRGLSLVYEMGDKNLKDELVRELVASFTGGGKSVKMGGGSVTSDTELFEPGALPTGGDGSVTTYKDIVSLASEMGDPSLVYRFMNLASNNAIWTSRSAFGRFGLSNLLTDSSYLAENKNFYPKLYRYRFDPNPNVQRSMNDIWNALVKDPGQVIDQNFNLIIEDLLKSIVDGKEWRIRQASCAAISDLLQGRDVDMYEQYLSQIWTKAFQVLDDIKETVRVAAMSLCRTLTNLLIRNLEVGTGMSSRAQKLLDYAMQFLLQQVQFGSAQELQDYALATLLTVVKKSPPRALREHAPVIVETLIVSMTSLEPEAVNYIHLNADKYGVTAEKLDSMRVSGVSSSPAMRAVERCIEGLDEKGMSDTMGKLANAFKSVIGLPSKVGLSSLLVTMAVRHSFEFRPYADGFARLLRKHLFDRNETVINSHCLSLAYLVRLSSDEELAKTADFTKSLYFGSEDVTHRQVAGDIVQAISKVANDRFAAFGSAFLPLAFIGRNDINAQVREAFQKTWEDNVGGNRAVSLYLMEIVDLARHLDSPQWGIKHTVSSAVGDMISSLDSVVSEDYTDEQATAIWSILEKALAGKTWEGKETVVTAFPKFVKHAPALRGSKRAQFGTIAVREAKRTNSRYRPHAIRALGEMVTILGDQDLARKTIEVTGSLVEELADESTNRMELDDKSASLEVERQRQADLDKTLAAVVECSFKAVALLRQDQQAVSEEFGTLKTILDQSLSMGSRLTQMAMLEGINKYFSTISSGSHQEPNREMEGVQVQSPSSEEGAEKNAAMHLILLLLPSASIASDSDERRQQQQQQQPPHHQRSNTSILDNATEALRLARAQAIQTFASAAAAVSSSSSSSLSSSSTLLPLTSQEKEAISRAIKTWLDSERSTHIRRILSQAYESLSAAA